MDLIERRRGLAERGLLKEAREMDPAVRQSAREDRRAWLADGLERKFWDPVKLLSKGRTQSVVALRGPGAAQGAEAG